MTNPQPHIRLWDREMHLLYDSDTDPRTAEEYFFDEALAEANYSKDYGQGWVTRDAGRLIRSADNERLIWSSNREWLTFMTRAANDAVMDDPSRFGSDLPRIERGSRVGVTVGDKIMVGIVRSVHDEHGTRYIEMEEEELR